MLFTATITAYDMLGDVGVSANVYAYEGTPSPHGRNVYHTTTTVQGVGEDRPQEWLRDALIAMLEAI